MKQQTKIVIRNIKKNPVYFILTFTGFTLGIIASLLIYLWVYNELSFDRFHPDYKLIYRVLTLSKQGDEIIKSPGCYRPLPKTMKNDYPQIEYATYISYNSEDSPLKSEEGGEKVDARMCTTNEDFFNIFKGFKFIEGSQETAFKNPDNIVLTEITAKKIFGNLPALGKTLISDKYSKEVYTVGGVVQIPRQSHIDFGFIISEKNSRFSVLSNDWRDKSYVRVYIKLKKDMKLDNQFLTDITNQVSRYSKYTDKLMFQPLADIHLKSDYQNDMFDRNPGSSKYVWLFSGFAILIILMASLNFSTLSIARSSERSIEIALRKVSGGTNISIFRQFLSESVLQTIIATILALIIVQFILPWFNTLTSNYISLNFSTGLVINLVLLTLLIGIISGIYPSVYLASFNPVSIFRGGSISGSRSNFIRLLVTVQFFLAIFFIVATVIIIKQLYFIQNKNLGIDDKNVVVVSTGLWYGNKEFKEELLKNPGVLSVSASAGAPIDVGFNGSLPLSHLGSIDSLKVKFYFVDEDFAKTYKLEVIKGQFLQMSSQAYWEEFAKLNQGKNEGKEYTISIPIVINETAEKMLNFKDPIGQRIGNNVIVGVVKDFHFRSLHHGIEPLVMSNNPEVIGTMNIRIYPKDISGTLKFIRETYEKNRNGREFSYIFFDDLLKKTYLAETRLRNITIVFAFLAIIICLLGIFGMAIFSIDRRIKEIGIRKAFGAISSGILLLMNKEFIIWVSVAFIIATPLSWYTMHEWLKNFVYKTDLSCWVFLFAGVLAMGIAIITVSWQSWRAAIRNPAEALRYE